MKPPFVLQHFSNPSVSVGGGNLDCFFEVIVFETFCGEDLSYFLFFAFGEFADVELFGSFGFLKEL